MKEVKEGKKQVKSIGLVERRWRTGAEISTKELLVRFTI
jgi:hypothetical protein